MKMLKLLYPWNIARLLWALAECAWNIIKYSCVIISDRSRIVKRGEEYLVIDGKDIYKYKHKYDADHMLNFIKLMKRAAFMEPDEL